MFLKTYIIHLFLFRGVYLAPSPVPSSLLLLLMPGHLLLHVEKRKGDRHLPKHPIY